MNQPPGWGQYGPPQGYPQPPAPKKGMSTFSAVLLALIVFFVVIPLGSCMACAVCAQVRRDEALAEPKTHAPAPTPIASADPVPTAPPAPTAIMVSVATFTPKNTLLDECTDITITPPTGWDGGLEPLAEAFAKGITPKNASRIYKACADQFRTSPVLATCANVHHSEPLKNDAGVTRGTIELDIESRYYDLDNLTNGNEYMKDCLDLKGDWQGLDKNSDEYREAVRARARRNVEKGLKALGQ